MSEKNQLYNRFIQIFYISANELTKTGIFSHLFCSLKGPKHEIFESGFFTQIRRLWLGDLGTGEKNELSKVGVIILRFSLRISY
jgi:hypothetical protein